MGLVNFPEMLTLELVNTYVRDSKEDILYNPDKNTLQKKNAKKQNKYLRIFLAKNDITRNIIQHQN